MTDSSALTHHEARERFGLADEVDGSVNDPRTHVEDGISYNERWTYHLRGGEERVVYWHRYDCRGVRIRAVDGSLREEDG